MQTLERPIKYRDETWDFRTVDTKRYTHCFHPYPAMMISWVAERILEEFGTNARLLFDPYCGTGTSLVEANLKGIDAIGTDINPLARLIAKAKTTVVPLRLLDNHLRSFAEYARSAKSGERKLSPRIPNFKNIDYWFSKDVQFWLAVIKEYIMNIENVDVSDFFKVAFSDTIREVSFTRKCEFKLYRMHEKQMSSFYPDVIHVMLGKLSRNRNGMAEFISLKENASISKIYGFDSVSGIPEDILPKESVDIVITSPPYGDSHTTVAYGQFSRLSNQWLGLEELNKVDKRSMGGIKKKEFVKFGFDALDDVISKIANIDENRAQDIISFYADYEKSIQNVSSVIKTGGIVAYVVGNRRVKGIEIPNDETTKTFFERNGFKHLKTIIRAIPNKRMPKRNSPTNITGITDTTMNSEYIVILKKG